MQAQSITFFTPGYAGDMQTGRPPKSERSGFGARVHALREAAGLTQQQVASQLGISQPSYALWERNDVALRAEQILKLTEILGVSTDTLLSPASNHRRSGGPAGKARRLFEAVSRLPRHHQHKILEVVEALVAQQAKTA